MDLTVNYAIDNSLVEAYNQANGTNYLAAPEGFARLDAASSQIAAGETTAKFSGKINSDKLFTGSNLDIVGDLLVPVRITSASLDGITVTTEVMYVPFSMDKELKGPWKLLEGEDNCYAKDPNNGGAAWIMQYTADKLFDGGNYRRPRMDILVRHSNRIPDNVRRGYGTAAGVHEIPDQRLLDPPG